MLRCAKWLWKNSGEHSLTFAYNTMTAGVIVLGLVMAPFRMLTGDYFITTSILIGGSVLLGVIELFEQRKKSD